MSTFGWTEMREAAATIRTQGHTRLWVTSHNGTVKSCHDIVQLRKVRGEVAWEGRTAAGTWYRVLE